MKYFLFDLAKFVLYFIIFLISVSVIGYHFQYDSNYFTIPNSKKYLFVGDSHLEFSLDDGHDSFANISQSSEIYMFTYLKILRVLETNQHIKHVFVDFCNFQIDQEQDLIVKSEDYLNSRYAIYYSLLGKQEFCELFKSNELQFIKSHLKALPKINIGSITSVNLLSDKTLGSFSPLSRRLSDSFVESKAQNALEHIDLAKLNLYYLSKIVELCQKNGVKLFLIRTPLKPRWAYLQNEMLFQKYKKDLLGNVIFLDFKELNLGDQYFADLEHLNKNGAVIFSNFLNNLINDGLLESEAPQLIINSKIKKYNTRH